MTRDANNPYMVKIKINKKFDDVFLNVYCVGGDSLDYNQIIKYLKYKYCYGRENLELQVKRGKIELIDKKTGISQTVAYLLLNKHVLYNAYSRNKTRYIEIDSKYLFWFIQDDLACIEVMPLLKSKKSHIVNNKSKVNIRQQLLEVA
ncbi:MAG: hypothetical protein QXV52_06870 [Nitrososphaeria archaeon]